ncbi:hypothetical protein NLM16_05340 [Bradyrhizobium brasilense]|uniref:hypothetical protein n=1 Tax=Bradyrhizobium brasilense TaxID=1419277 RepID=UPI002877C135|nr:hypothetical protein [Bradyrhizobium brasilense]MCP3413521.1 hypothetical protein [Bradyrhizobium brasilense]
MLDARLRGRQHFLAQARGGYCEISVHLEMLRSSCEIVGSNQRMLRIGKREAVNSPTWHQAGRTQPNESGTGIENTSGFVGKANSSITLKSSMRRQLLES